MRRSDREIKDKNKIKDIISACHCCRLGLNDNGNVYIVPLNFGYTENNGKYTFYFHSAKEGRKVDLINKNGCAGFEMDTNYMLHEGNIACEYTARFQSIIGSGKIAVVEERDEKIKALLAIMHHNTGRDNWEFSDSMLNAVCIFRLDAEELSCKEHL